MTAEAPAPGFLPTDALLGLGAMRMPRAEAEPHITITQQGALPGMTNSARNRRTHDLRRVPVCGEETALPTGLVSVAMSFTDADRARPEDVEVNLRCALQAHVGGYHHAFVLELDGAEAAAIWTRWLDGPPAELELRPDCRTVGPSENGSPACCEFADHPGAHTYDVYDPLAPPVAPLVRP